MLDDYKEKQPLFCNYVSRILETNKITHAYLIDTKGIDYGFDIALALSKSFLCKNDFKNYNNCKDCFICHSIDKNNYPDLKIIESNGKMIKKDQLLDLQQEFSMKPIYGKYLIYIIKDAHLLNKSSANTILKFLEEPNPNIIAILLTDNIYNVLDTIVSRCQILNLIPDNKENNNIFLKYYNDKNVEFKDFQAIEINQIIEFFLDLEQLNTKIIAKNDPYYFKDKLDLLFYVGLNIYIDVLNKKLNRKIINYNNFDDQLLIISNNNLIDDIIKKIDIINRYINNSVYNVNKELFIDNFIISFGGNSND